MTLNKLKLNIGRMRAFNEVVLKMSSLIEQFGISPGKHGDWKKNIWCWHDRLDIFQQAKLSAHARHRPPDFFVLGNIATTCSTGIQCFSHDVKTSSRHKLMASEWGQRLALGLGEASILAQDFVGTEPPNAPVWYIFPVLYTLGKNSYALIPTPLTNFPFLAYGIMMDRWIILGARQGENDLLPHRIWFFRSQWINGREES